MEPSCATSSAPSSLLRPSTRLWFCLLRRLTVSERGLKFKQLFTKNMTEKTAPSITPDSEKKGDYTRITFKPDLPRFGMEELDRDTVALLTRRVYDIAG